jgi:hypothetical protein
MVTSRTQAVRRREQQKANRLGRVRDAADEIGRMYAAWDFWRSTVKKLPPEARAAHRDRIAELLVNDALQMDTTRHLEVAA